MLFATHPLKGFPEAIETVFPQAQVQLCLVHQVRGSLYYVSWKQRKAVAADLKPIYQASTVEEAAQRLDEFAVKWDRAYPTISQMWRRNWEHLTAFFAYPADIRRVIYTTNAFESLNLSRRKVIKTRGSFPNQEAAFKLLYLALEHIAKKWTMPVQNWKAALQRFSILLGDRVPFPTPKSPARMCPRVNRRRPKPIRPGSTTCQTSCRKIYEVSVAAEGFSRTPCWACRTRRVF